MNAKILRTEESGKPHIPSLALLLMENGLIFYKFPDGTLKIESAGNAPAGDPTDDFTVHMMMSYCPTLNLDGPTADKITLAWRLLQEINVEIEEQLAIKTN